MVKTCHLVLKQLLKLCCFFFSLYTAEPGTVWLVRVGMMISGQKSLIYLRNRITLILHSSFPKGLMGKRRWFCVAVNISGFLHGLSYTIMKLRIQTVYCHTCVKPFVQIESRLVTMHQLHLYNNYVYNNYVDYTFINKMYLLNFQPDHSKILSLHL